MKQMKPEDGMVLPDSEIVGLFFARDESAIGAVVRKYGKYLFSVTGNYLIDRSDREECVSDAYFAAWNAIPPTEPISLPAFLTKLVIRISIDRYKMKNRAKRGNSGYALCIDELEEVLPSASSVESELENEILSGLLSDFLRSLDERDRFIFLSRYYTADTVAVIAGMLGIGTATVNRSLAKSKSRLKIYLKKEGFLP